MKHLLFIIICGGALLLCPALSRAAPYTLSYSLVAPGHKSLKGSRAPKRPLVVDLVGHTLTLPSQVIGNTLTLENEDGEVYTYLYNRYGFPNPRRVEWGIYYNHL